MTNAPEMWLSNGERWINPTLFSLLKVVFCCHHKENTRNGGGLKKYVVWMFMAQKLGGKRGQDDEDEELIFNIGFFLDGVWCKTSRKLQQDLCNIPQTLSSHLSMVWRSLHSKKGMFGTHLGYVPRGSWWNFLRKKSATQRHRYGFGGAGGRIVEKSLEWHQSSIGAYVVVPHP